MPLLSTYSLSGKTVTEDVQVTNGHLLVYPIIAVWNITESIEELCQLLPNGKDYLNIVQQKFNSETRQKEWLAVRALCYFLLSKPSEILYHTSGRPFLRDSDLHISISHTKGYAALALSKTPKGIDIETWSPKAMKLKSKFLQESEMQLSLTKTSEDDAVVLWSAKESVYKIQEHQSPNLKDDILIFKKEQSLCAKSNRENQIAQILFYTHPDFVLTSATYYPIEI